MLKIIALITCDQCGGVLSQIAAADRVSDSLLDDIHQLQICAEEQNWIPRKCSTEHYCKECNYCS